MFTAFSLNYTTALFRQKWKFSPYKRCAQIILRCISVKKDVCTENVRNQLLRQVTKSDHTGAKVTVVGSGRAGMAITFSLFRQGVVTRLAMVADDEKVLQGEMMDMMHGSIFLDNRQMVAQKDYSITEKSAVCVIAAGHTRGGDTVQTYETVAQSNLSVIKKIIPEILRLSPEVIFIVVTNPVDLVSYAVWRLSGLPPERIIGVGTMMDSVRFQFYISQRLKLDPLAVKNAWILGVHNVLDFTVPIWSTILVNTVPLLDIEPSVCQEGDPNGWNSVYTAAVRGGSTVVGLKGYSSWTIGVCVSALIRALLITCNIVMPVSTRIKGWCGIEDDIFLSVPCMLCRNGVWNVMNLPLTEAQRDKLVKTAKHLAKMSRSLKL